MTETLTTPDVTSIEKLDWDHELICQIGDPIDRGCVVRCEARAEWYMVSPCCGMHGYCCTHHTTARAGFTCLRCGLYVYRDQIKWVRI